MMRKNKNPAARSGFTLIELLVVVAIIALLVSILLPSLARAREMGKRAVCSSNLRGIGTAFNSYSTNLQGLFPIPLNPNPTVQELANPAYAGDAGVSTKAFAMIVKRSNRPPISPKVLTCPSTDDTPMETLTVANTPAESLAFGWGQCSYGYQVPYGMKGRPSTNLDANMAIAADKGPFGAAILGSKVAPPVITNTKVVSADANSGPSGWRPYNSPNHGGAGEGEGQNVMYPDGRVDWAATPLAGVGAGGQVSKDNIYTQWADPATGLPKIANAYVIGTPAQRIRGVGPSTASNGTQAAPMGDTDSLIYP